MKLTLFPVIFLGVLFNSGAQLALKAGVNRIGSFSINWSNLIPVSLQMAINPWILLGMFFYLFSIVIWLFVLSRIDVSIAYPLVSLGYIVNAIAAYYLLGENVNFLRIAGICVILIGVFMVVRS